MLLIIVLYLGATWSKVDDASKQNRATRYAKVESFLEMGGFPSVQPFNLYSRTVRNLNNNTFNNTNN